MERKRNEAMTPIDGKLGTDGLVRVDIVGIVGNAIVTVNGLKKLVNEKMLRN